MVMGIVYIVVAVLYVVLGLSIEKDPFLVSMFGLILSLFAFWVNWFGIFMILALIYAFYCGIRYRRAKREVDLLETEMEKYR